MISSSLIGLLVFIGGLTLIMSIIATVVAAVAFSRSKNGTAGPPGPEGPAGPPGPSDSDITVYRQQLATNTPSVVLPVAYDPANTPLALYHTMTSFAVPADVEAAMITFTGTINLSYPGDQSMGTTPATHLLLTLSPDETPDTDVSVHTIIEIPVHGTAAQFYNFTITDLVQGLSGRVYLRAETYQSTNGIGEMRPQAYLVRGGTWMVTPATVPV